MLNVISSGEGGSLTIEIEHWKRFNSEHDKIDQTQIKATSKSQGKIRWKSNHFIPLSQYPFQSI